MFGFHPLHWFFGPFGWLYHFIPTIIVLVILYWIIRLAVRHGTKDARKSKS